MVEPNRAEARSQEPLIASPTVGGEGDHIEAAPIGSLTANYAVVDRIRDLAKWLLVALGAIAGVLLAGSKLSDIGATHGDGRVNALIGVGVGLFGAAIALGFIARVLLPIRLTLSDLENEVNAAKRAKERDGDHEFKRWWRRLRWPVGELVNEEGQVLSGYSVETLKTARKDAADAERTARNAEPVVEETVRNAQENRRAIDEVVYEFLAYALAEKVKRRMMWATGAVAVGAAFAAGGIVVFSVATHESDLASAGEVVPKRLNAVVVRLTSAGREELSDDLGRRCEVGRLRALALGGPPSAIELITVPRSHCRAARLTLSPDIGSVVNVKPLPTLRSCAIPHPQMPCVVYPNSVALIAGEP
jgi:hypothetical protein